MRIRIVEFILILIVYALLPILPITLFLRGAPPDISFFLVVSRAAGIYAFVWLAFQFAVTSRIRFLERISGQDRLLVYHMAMAVGAIVLTYVHTSFGGHGPETEILEGFGSVGQNVFLIVGIFSAIFFSNFFIRFIPKIIPYRNRIAKLLRINYEKCLWLHYAMPIAMALVLVHVMLLPGGDYFRFKLCMAAIAVVCLAAYAWRKLAAPALIKRSPWIIDDVVRESDSVATLFFGSTTGKKLPHRPGQFCYVAPMDGNLPRQSHPFTISSSPEDERPTVTVKNLGDFTKAVQSLLPGARVCLDGPYGTFSCAKTPKEHSLFFIAGGIGITPMISMLRYLSQKEPNRKVTLVWGVREANDLVRVVEINNLRKKMPDCVVMPVVSRDRNWKGRTGRVDKTLLAEMIKERGCLSGENGQCTTDFFVCGPPPMISSVMQALKELEIPKERIHMERFAF